MRYILIVITLLFGLTCLWLASSQWGIGYDPDSIIYEDVAENLFSGYGISRFNFDTGDRYPMTNFPPFYPMVLGVLSQIVGSVSASARLLNTVLWACLWVIAYMWIRRDNASHSIAWMMTSLLLLNLFIFQVFGTSWSEPLFLVLGFSGLWLIISYLQTEKLEYVMGAGAVFACAILTRYAGVALVGTSAIVILTATHQAWRRRVTSIIVLGGISGTPLLLWLIRNVTVRGDVANRDVGFTLVGLPQLETAIQTIGTWLLPVPVLTVNLVVIGLMVVLVAWSWNRTRKKSVENTDPIINIMRWWVLIYVLFIIASFTLLDPRIPFNYRILLPAWVGVMIWVGRWLALNWQALSKAQHYVWRITAIVLLSLNAILSLNWATVLWQSGQQYSSAIFQKSEIISDLRENPPTATLYTNNSFLYHYQTNHPANTLPFADTTDFDAWLDTLPDEPIQIMFFNVFSQRNWESSELLEQSLPVTELMRDEAIVIYELERP